MAIIDGLDWYVTHTQTRKKGEVEMTLERQGLEIFLPMVVRPSRRRDRIVKQRAAAISRLSLS